MGADTRAPAVAVENEREVRMAADLNMAIGYGVVVGCYLIWWGWEKWIEAEDVSQ